MGAHRTGRVAALAAALVLSGMLGPVAAADDSGAASLGRWSAPFVEPTIGDRSTDEHCVEDTETEHDGRNVSCKPAAGSMAVLGGADVVYWDALEDMEEVEHSVVAEFGAVSVNDQTRVLHLGPTPTWSEPAPNDGGASAPTHPLFGDAASDETYNDGALFCASLTFLPDGRVLAVGGTAYYHDPAIASRFGVSELEGLASTRIFDPRTGRWSQAGDMHRGRWYPSSVPLADGKVFVASGVTRLVKPVYADQPPTESGRNVVDTETFDPATGTWTKNPDSADRTLPLYPRLHLLPGGRVYFNAAGQVFNPNGYAYDEVLWNQAAAYDPASQRWVDMGIPGLGTPAPGFRGSTFSIMLPLRPGTDGTYRTAEFLTAGGILGTSPGTYFALADSRIDAVDAQTLAVTSRSTGPLQQPRWYGTGVLTPTGEVIAFSGASADEVVGPGTGRPVTVPEIFDPETEAWRALAGATERRTYHNTAALLPDGRILVGGHAPISTLYTANTTLIPGVTSPQETRNPTFEIFEPPYLFRGDRPTIHGAPSRATPGDRIPVTVDVDGSEVASVVLVRRTAITHLVDGGQRAVELPIVERKANKVTVQVPTDPSVVPPGPYLLFVNRKTGEGPVPSVGEDLTIGAGPTPLLLTPLPELEPDGPRPAPDLAAAGAVPVPAELAFHEIAELSGRHDHGSHDHRSPPGPPAATWPALGALGVVAYALRRRVTSTRLG